MQPTFTTNFLGIVSTYRHGWAASIYDRTDTERGYELRTYRFDERGDVSFHPTMEDAKAAATAFVMGAPEWKPRRTCRWCGQVLPYSGRCPECGEQF